MKNKIDAKSRREFLKSSAAAGALIGMPFGVAVSNEGAVSNENLRLDEYRTGKKRREIGEHKFNQSYSGEYLNYIAFPIGGIGAGMFCMEGTGAIAHVSVKNSPAIFNEAFAFAAISIKGKKAEPKF